MDKKRIVKYGWIGEAMKLKWIFNEHKLWPSFSINLDQKRGKKEHHSSIGWPRKKIKITIEEI